MGWRPRTGLNCELCRWHRPQSLLPGNPRSTSHLPQQSRARLEKQQVEDPKVGTNSISFTRSILIDLSLSVSSVSPVSTAFFHFLIFSLLYKLPSGFLFHASAVRSAHTFLGVALRVLCPSNLFFYRGSTDRVPSTPSLRVISHTSSLSLANLGHTFQPCRTRRMISLLSRVCACSHPPELFASCPSLESLHLAEFLNLSFFASLEYFLSTSYTNSTIFLSSHAPLSYCFTLFFFRQHSQ